ncbi:DUF397 domain-containing protein [Micromonosporaceae bacterium B7E4]
MSDPQFTNTTDDRFTDWSKSEQTSGPSEGCLYVARANDGSGDVALTESEAGPTGPITVVNARSWEAFLAGAKLGAFDSI